MTFTENQQFSNFEEERNKGTAEKAADGTDVGLPDTQKLDTAEKKEDNNKKPTISPEDYEKQNIIALQKVEIAKDKNPDWPPAKGNPEAEAQLSSDLEAGMNTL